MFITVARFDSTPRKALLSTLTLPEGTTFAAALQSLGFSYSRETTGLWCHSVAPETVLHAGDRIDIATPLVINRVEARRLRAKKSEKPAKALLARHGGKRQLVK